MLAEVVWRPQFTVEQVGMPPCCLTPMLSPHVLQLNMELQSVLFEIEEAICRPDPEPILTEMIHQVNSYLQ